MQLSVLDADEMPKMDKMLSEIKGLVITKNALEYALKLTPEDIIALKSQLLFKPLRRLEIDLINLVQLNQMLLRDKVKQILFQLPGIKTAEDEKAAKELISKPANLG